MDTASLSAIFDPTSPVLISLPVVFVVFKTLFLILGLIYIVYAFVIVRQIGLMSRTVSTSLDGFLKLLALLHLLGALLLWVMVFLIHV